MGAITMMTLPPASSPPSGAKGGGASNPMAQPASMVVRNFDAKCMVCLPDSGQFPNPCALVIPCAAHGNRCGESVNGFVGVCHLSATLVDGWVGRRDRWYASRPSDLKKMGRSVRLLPDEAICLQEENGKAGEEERRVSSPAKIGFQSGRIAQSENRFPLFARCRSEGHPSALKTPLRIPYAVLRLKKKNIKH